MKLLLVTLLLCGAALAEVFFEEKFDDGGNYNNISI